MFKTFFGTEFGLESYGYHKFRYVKQESYKKNVILNVSKNLKFKNCFFNPIYTTF